MDLYCPLCGEPWDNDTFHEQAEEDNTTYRSVVRLFNSKGCSALGSRCNSSGNPAVAAASAATFDMLGSDTDGIACMMEDFLASQGDGFGTVPE